MKLYYWSPFISPVATVFSVINSIKSIKKFSKEQVDCRIINVFKEWDHYDSAIKKNEIQVINLSTRLDINYLPKGGVLKSRFTYVLVFFFSVTKLHLLIRKDKPDYLLIHLITFVPLFLLLIFNYKTQFILRISGYPKMNLLRKIFWRLINKKIYKIICPTFNTKKILLDKKIFDSNKLFIVEDPVLDIESIRNKLKVDSDIVDQPKDKYVISVGRLTKQKNFTFLIDGFKEVNKKIQDINLIIIGEGEEKKKLQSKIINYNLQNKIFLKGYKENIYPYLKNSLFLILTSKWEDPGFVILESMFCKKIVLSSNCLSGPIEIIQDENNGFLYDMDNMDSFVSKFIVAYNTSQYKDLKKKKIIYNAMKSVKNYTLFHHFKQIRPHINL
jgi:glycosyltransferase involved in cell wall biosynthesis